MQRLGPPHWRGLSRRGALRGARRERAEAALARGAADRRTISREVGITVDCAPVLDVADEATHAVIGSRAYSRDPERRRRARPRRRCDGLIAGGVAPVVKHMPGHGRARADSHLELPRRRGEPRRARRARLRAVPRACATRRRR